MALSAEANDNIIGIGRLMSGESRFLALTFFFFVPKNDAAYSSLCDTLQLWRPDESWDFPIVTNDTEVTITKVLFLKLYFFVVVLNSSRRH